MLKPMVVMQFKKKQYHELYFVMVDLCAAIEVTGEVNRIIGLLTGHLSSWIKLAAARYNQCVFLDLPVSLISSSSHLSFTILRFKIS